MGVLPRPTPVGVILVVGLVLSGCTPVTPTSAPPSQAILPIPVASALPGWAIEATKRWAADSPEARDLSHPDAFYQTAGSANGEPNGISYTPTQARLWWDYWFLHPVHLGTVGHNLLPGSLVLSQDEVKRAQAMMGAGNTLPKAPADYNPLGLPVVP